MTNYHSLAYKVLDDEVLSRGEARSILQASAEDFHAVLNAVLMVRERYHGRKVKLCVLQNARSGLCPEDCHYCSQSVVSDAAIHYNFIRSVCCI